MISAYSNPPVIEQITTWAIRPGQLQFSATVDEASLLQALKTAGLNIMVVTSDTDWDSICLRAIDLPEPRESLEPSLETVWEGNLSRVVIADQQKLWIMPVRSVKRIEELTEQEWLDMKDITAKLSVALKEVGFSDYVEFIPNGKNAGQRGENLYLELIPSRRLSDSQAVDVVAKLQRCFYILSGGAYNDNDVSLTERQASRISAVVRRILSENFELKGSRDDRSVEFVQKWHHLAQARTWAATHLMKVLQDAGAQVCPLAVAAVGEQAIVQANNAIKQDVEGEFSDVPVVLKKTDCAFCNPAVINRQMIVPGQTEDILYNYIPFVEGRHFMTVTHHHVENPVHMNTDEQLEELALIKKVGAFFSKTMESHDYKVWKQAGPQAGRTVLHDHAHVITNNCEETKQWLATVLMELVGTKQKPVAADAYEKLRIQFHQLN